MSPDPEGGRHNDAQQTLVHQKGCYICQWLDNVDMHLYAKIDQNISCVSSVMSLYSLTEDT